MSDKDLDTTPEQTQKRVANERKGKRKVSEKAKQLDRLEIQYESVDDIKPNEYNPNRQSEEEFELLLRSIEDDGFTQPVIVTNDLTIVDGEHRWRAAMTLGMKKIPVVMVDMSAEQARMSTIRHNRARGSHNIDLETEVLKDLQNLGAMEWVKDALMMSDDEINARIEDLPASELLAGEYHTESWEPSKETMDGFEDSRKKTVETSTGSRDISASEEAIKRMKDSEERMKEATSEKERRKIKEENELYRVNLVFEGDEGKYMENILGEKPSDTVLEWCKQEA